MISPFYIIGRYFASNPFMGVNICFAITFILSLGLYNLRLELDPQNLWVSKDSRTYVEQEKFADDFGKFFRTNQFIFNYRDGTSENILDKPQLEVIYFLQNIINGRKIKNNGKEINVDDLCYKPISGKGCLAPSPMDFWLQDPRILNRDDDIQYTLLCIESVDLAQTNIPCSDRNGVPVIKEAVFGGTWCVEREHDTQPCDHCWIKAKVMSVTYLLNNNQFTGADAALWEKDIFQDTLTAFNEKRYDYLKTFYNDEIWPAPSNEQLEKVIYKVEFLMERSVSDELVTETNQNYTIVIFSYTLMLLYVGLAIGQFPSKIFNGFLLGLGGIIIVMLSMLCSIGFVSYLDIGLTMISAEVIPFLLLAIGVDNMFIITHSFSRVSLYSSVPDRMGKALESVGPSITTAALCESLAFLVGALTKMPALQTFCVQAAFGVFIDYIFQITTFVAFLTWDTYRKESKRYDIVFCMQDEDYEGEENRELVRKVFSKFYIPLLKNKICIGITCLLTVGLFILSIFGCMKLEVGLEEQVSFVSDGDLYNYFTYEKKYIEIGPLAYVVLEGLDYRKQSDLDMVNKIANDLSLLEDTVQPPIYSWVQAFHLFTQTGMEWNNACETNDIDLYDFPTQLKRFMETKITSNCCQQYGICGETFVTDIIVNEDGYVKASRLRFQHRPIHNSADYILSLEETRQAIDKITEGIPKDQNIFVYSLPYVFYDQYSYIRSVAISNTLLGLATIFLMVTLIQDAIVAIIVCVGVFLISFNLVGVMWLLNVIFGGFQLQINAISVVNLVICLGLAVEFVVHVSIKFRKSTQGNRWDRMEESMTTMGNSVFVGIATTKFLGVLVLGFASSTLFRLYYFRMYIVMIILGTFNGLCLLPIILGLIGPVSSGPRSKATSSSDYIGGYSQQKVQ